MSQQDGKMPWAQGDSIIKNYQNNNSISGQPRLYTRDDQDRPVALKAWWIDLDHLNRLKADAEAVVGTGNVSGFRMYVALRDKDHMGQAIPDEHTLVFAATVKDSTLDEHDNIRVADLAEYVRPCPKICNRDMNSKLGN